MPRAITILVGVCGLAAAVYLVFFHRPPAPVLEGLGSMPDYGVPFGIAIAVVSVLLLGTVSRRRLLM
jgi:hypothetical protein